MFSVECLIRVYNHEGEEGFHQGAQRICESSAIIPEQRNQAKRIMQAKDSAPHPGGEAER